MTHSRAPKAPWRGMVIGKRHYVVDRSDDLRYWQRMAAAATQRFRTVRRFVARQDERGVYVVRVELR